MITLSLQFQNQIDILDIQKEQNSLIRFAYSRFCEEKNWNEVKQSIKRTFNLKYCDSWFVSASIEIARRGYKKFTKGWFWPKLPNIDQLSNQWKEEVKGSLDSWKELISQIKNSKVKYRVPLESFSNQTRGFRISSQRSKVRLVEVY
jgi:predicted transposase